jgi:hypothetical protein
MVPAWTLTGTEVATLPAPAASAGIGSGVMGRSRFHDIRTLTGELEPGTMARGLGCSDLWDGCHAWHPYQ